MQRRTGDVIVRTFFGENFVNKILNNIPVSLEVA